MPGLSDFLVECAQKAGTRAIFGLPGGGGNLDLIQAAGRAGLPFVLTSTETGSAIAAIAQSEITGAPGVCLTTIGPGAASIANGAACAMLERAPILILTDSYGADSASFEHQRVDHCALLSPIVKLSRRLTTSRAYQETFDAFTTLSELPPGPVHLDMAADAHAATRPDTIAAYSPGVEIRAWSADAEQLLSRARKPLLIVGLGARAKADAEAIQTLCERRAVPAMVTYKAKGVIPDRHPWFAGVFTNAVIERPLVEESDLLIGIGFDPVEVLPRPWTFAQPVLSVSSWPPARDHVPFADERISRAAMGPASFVIGSAISELVDRLPESVWSASRIRDHVDACARAIDIPTAGLSAQQIVTVAAAGLAGRVRVTVDAGAHMLAATSVWPCAEPNELLISNGLSTMGFALPAAIGAAVLERDRPVVALTGDGGLLICMGELATVARERLKVMTIVLNDASLSLIEIKQQARKLPPAGVAIGEVNWPRIAEGFGIPAWTASNTTELAAAIDQAAGVDGPTLIEARIDRSNYAATMKAIRG